MNISWNGTITDVPGIFASGISSGIKKDGSKDLCIIYSKYKTNSAAVFTRNKVKAAPLIIDMENIKSENTQAIVINSGNANSCTGEQGLRNAQVMIDTAAKCLNLSSQDVLVASTGALSRQLPMDVIVPGIEKACSSISVNSGMDAAEAILSTDKCTKTISVKFELGGKEITIAGMTKGSTMIHPNMGTTLTFIATDANISKPLLNKALKDSIDISYNMISIDGDTSTNDMAVILANGASKHNIIEVENENYQEFSKELNTVCTELAKMIVKDGEGSTRFMEVSVVSAKTLYSARAAARAIVSSNLVKCELFGGALKSSTIACVLGYSCEEFDPQSFDIFISNDQVKEQFVKNAIEVNYDKYAVDSILKGPEIKLIVDLKYGSNSTTAWGCDLTYEYVKANGYLM